MFNRPLYIDNGNGPERNPDLTDDEFNALLAWMVWENSIELWRAATNYELKYISGSAPVFMLLGVIMGKPKATACKNWVFSIWNQYYEKKSSITHEQNSHALEDFSASGAMPYSVPEILIEGAEALSELQVLLSIMKSKIT